MATESEAVADMAGGNTAASGSRLAAVVYNPIKVDLENLK